MENKLPKGWVEVNLNKVLVSLESGSRPKGGVRGIRKGVPSIGGEHLNDNGKFNFTNIKHVPESFASMMNRGHIKKGDILIVKDGATTGKTSFVDIDFPYQNAVVNEHVFICRPSTEVHPKYLFYYLWSNQGKERILENFRGSAQGGINTSFSSNMLIPVAPIEEQQQIVFKLDSLFDKIESNRRRLERISQILKRFRLSVLNAAVNGDLTKGWRVQNSEFVFVKTKQVKKKARQTLNDKVQDYELFDLPTNWIWSTISEVADVKGGKRVPKGERLVDHNTGFPYIKAGDLKNGTVQKHKLQFLLSTTRQKIKRYVVSKGDVYITNVGACIGDAGVIPDDLDGANLTENALKICNHEGVYNHFMSYWLQSPIAQDFIKQTILSAAQGKLALGRLEVFPIPMPPIEEQKEIVRRIEQLFSFDDKIEARFKKAKFLLDKLPQTMLSSAFRGELVPQNPNDEPASVLLERIKAEREKRKIQKKR